jgi:hypothetical protein
MRVAGGAEKVEICSASGAEVAIDTVRRIS